MSLVIPKRPPLLLFIVSTSGVNKHIRRPALRASTRLIPAAVKSPPLKNNVGLIGSASGSVSSVRLRRRAFSLAFHSLC